MKRESKGNVAAEIKINFFIFIHYLHSRKKWNYASPIVG